MFGWLQKKKAEPKGNSESVLNDPDLTKKAPEVDDVLAEVDKALEKAAQLKKQIILQPKKEDSCWC